MPWYCPSRSPALKVSGGARQLHQPRLGGGIAGDMACHTQTQNRGDVHDRATRPCHDHRARRRLRHQQRAGLIGLDHAVPAVQVQRDNRIGVGDARIVDDNVKGWSPFEGPRDRSAVTDVQFLRPCVSPGPGDGIGDVGKRLGPAGGKRHPSAFAREHSRKMRAKPA